MCIRNICKFIILDETTANNTKFLFILNMVANMLHENVFFYGAIFGKAFVEEHAPNVKSHEYQF